MGHAKFIPPVMQTVGTPLQRLTRGACTVIVKHGGATVEVASRALVQNVTFTIRTGRQDRVLTKAHSAIGRIGELSARLRLTADVEAAIAGTSGFTIPFPVAR